MPASRKRKVSRRKILAIDVGGSHVKVALNTSPEERKFVSGSHLSAKSMVSKVKRLTHDWTYDVISIGFPGPVVHGRPIAEPINLGRGWIGFDFERGFGCPVRVVNDAAMQAIGSYTGGRMLFLGLGTGLGSAMIIEGVIEPMELAHLPYRKGKTFEDYVGADGLKRLGKKKWLRRVADVVERLTAALEPEYVVIGGGNAQKLEKLPLGARLGGNDKAFDGGFKLWSGKYRL
jgi:polyphosphate glucokinase